MTKRYVAPYRRIMAPVILVVFVAIVWQLGVEYWWPVWKENQLEIGRISLVIQEYQKMIDARDRLEERLYEVERHAEHRSIYMEGSDAGETARALATYARRIIEEKYGVVEEVRLLGEEDSDVSGRVGVQIQCRIIEAQLQDILWTLETTGPVIFITELTIYGNDIGEKGEEGTDIVLIMKIYGYRNEFQEHE